MVRTRRRAQPGPRDLDTLPVHDLIALINQEDRRVAPAVGRVIPQIAAAVEVIVQALRRGGRLIYVGAGTSGRLGLLDALECPPTFGVAPQTVRAVVAGGVRNTVARTSPREDDASLGRAEMARLAVGADDVVVGIAASGDTPFTLGAVQETRRRGARVIGLTTTPGSPLVRQAEIAIVPEVGEEVLRGSTRMKAGTAEKLVLNILSTATMVRLGHVYGNLMIGVRPLNAKLRRRARDLVAAATGVSAPKASRLLASASGDAKVAVVMALAAVDAREARRLLAVSGGFVREAIWRASAPNATRRRSSGSRRRR